MTDFRTIDECRAMLTEEMLDAIKALERCAPGLPVNVQAAFADAIYNLGPFVACDIKKSTAARMLKDKRYSDACNQLPKWNRAKVAGVSVELPGLTKRRTLERDLCLS